MALELKIVLMKLLQSISQLKLYCFFQLNFNFLILCIKYQQGGQFFCKGISLANKSLIQLCIRPNTCVYLIKA